MNKYRTTSGSWVSRYKPHLIRVMYVGGISEKKSWGWFCYGNNRRGWAFATTINKYPMDAYEEFIRLSLV